MNPSLNAFISQQSKGAPVGTGSSGATVATVGTGATVGGSSPVEVDTGTSTGTSTVINTDAAPTAIVTHTPTNTNIPKRTVVLTNMVSVEEARTDPDLKNEIEEEALNYGKLSNSITIDIESDIDNIEGVKITLQYNSEDDASKAFLVMNGRNFGGRTIRALLL